MLSSIPEELRKYNQWCVSPKGIKIPQLPNGTRLRNASIINDHWLSYDEACRVADQIGGNIGFVLTANDPFICIDVDIKDAESIRPSGESYDPCDYSSAENLSRYERVLDLYDSYAELSLSNKGIHVWIKGVMKAGVQKDGVDVYPHERYIVCTGKPISELRYHVHNNVIYTEIIGTEAKPIVKRQKLLDTMLAEIKRHSDIIKGEKPIELIELEPVHNDDHIFNTGSQASNAEKFIDLCNGNWKKYHYPSQSEADYALISMLAFYSKSNEQVRRMFRKTAMGARAKATKNDVYLNRTLQYIRQSQEQQVEVTINLERQSNELRERLAKKVEPAIIRTGGLPVPPGKLGKLVEFIYNSSPRPVKEVSITAALGLLAGICGKAYTIPQSGLNLYVVIVGKSGIGKEAMLSGPGLLLDKIRNGVPRVDNFVNYSSFVSGNALVKDCAKNPCFVNINGEWGRRLKEMSDSRRGDSPLQQLRTVMTNIYQKSSPTSISGGLSYSSKDNAVDSVVGVAYSMIGDTTPQTYYDALDMGMMEDGFLSRFTTIHYEGERPAKNDNINIQPSESLINDLSSMITYVLQLLDHRTNIEVKFSDSVKAKLDAFDKQCDEQINATDNESFRQVWNRAHLKVLKICALQAAFENCLNPIVNDEQFAWALNLVMSDVNNITDKINKGDVGSGDNVRYSKLIEIIKTYFNKDSVPAGYQVPRQLANDGVVPLRYLNNRSCRIKCFYDHKNGSTFALNETVKTLVNSGMLEEIESYKVHQKYGKSYGKCYRVIDLDV